MRPVPVALDIADGHAIAFATTEAPRFDGANAVRRGVQVTLRRLEVATPRLRAACDHGGYGPRRDIGLPDRTLQVQLAGDLPRVAAVPGDDRAKPLWMNSVVMPFFANFFGSGSGGSVAATSTLALMVDAGSAKRERNVRMSYFRARCSAFRPAARRPPAPQTCSR